jgi:hypothetical protein
MSMYQSRLATHQSQSYFCTANVSKNCETYVNRKRADFLNLSRLPLTCHKCGEQLAKDKRHTIAPINKSNYMVITDLELLKQLNPKRTT